MKQELTCIVCPLGCSLVVERQGDTLRVTGNTCPRGREYAETECTAPMRTVTSTVRTADGGRVSVKTDRPIPKERIGGCMKIIHSAVAPLPIAAGTVIIEDVFGCNIVATASREGESSCFHTR